MYDPYGSRREQRRYYRAQRRYYRYSNPLRGIGTAFFLIALVIGIALERNLNGSIFLVMLFVGLAFLCLFGSLGSLNRHGIYGGFHGFLWCLGLALCFAIGFWPWILLPVAATILLSSLFNPIMAGLAGSNFLAASQMPPPPPSQQPVPPQEQAGYQGDPPPPTSQEQERKQE